MRYTNHHHHHPRLLYFTRNYRLQWVLCVMFVGDILDIKVVRAWEFNSTFPLRSIIPIYLSTAMPLLLLKTLSYLCGFVISWYSLTVAVRLTITLLGLITDYSVMKLAGWVGGRDAVSAAVVMATSYISLVYYSRTFSNTVESFLYAALLYFITRKSHKRIYDIPYAVVISMLIVVGVFNRPTFVVYAVVPYLWWLFSDGVDRVIVKSVNSVVTAVPVSILLIICDSIYFGHLDINNLDVADLSDIMSFLSHNITVTPLNFVLYNTQSGNLAEHGIHPRFTHFVVNIPLLFSVLSVCFFYDVLWWCMTVVWGRTWKVVSTYRRHLMLLGCCVVPVTLLSMFPHQEPRFLIPLLPVFMALYADKITSAGGMLALWVVANLLGCLFYGCVHQAGVVPCLGYLQQTQPDALDRRVIFWHTYTAPQHLLLLPQQYSGSQDPDHNGNSPVTVHSGNSPVHTGNSLKSLEGNSIEDLIYHLTLMNSLQSSQRWGKPEVMVAAPSSEHHYLVCKAAEAGIRLDISQSFWPHLSTEHPPNLDDIVCRVKASRCRTITDDNVDSDDDNAFCNRALIDRIRFLTALNLYRVTFL